MLLLAHNGRGALEKRPADKQADQDEKTENEEDRANVHEK
jgi:predicted small lipoprotein YifL